MRHSQITFLCSFLLVLVGCHNNAHLRTQKILKPGEKAYSGSGVLAMGGAEDGYNSNTGVMGLRGEVSMLKGGKDFESGPYLGFGANFNVEEFGFIAGYDYRKYTGQGSGSPKKLGAQIEVNFSEAGAVFHLRPSITSTTKRGRPLYGGIHGLLAIGSLADYGYGYVYDRDIEIDYRFNSLGAGLTAGVEAITFDNNSIQLQVDVSMVKNSFSIVGRNKLHPNDWEDELFPIVTGSIGMSFFKPDPTSKESFEPLPTPSYNTGQTQTQPVFDPETGEVIVEKQTGYKFVDDATVETQFAPETGEKISGGMHFDPETGEAIIETRFNPETGEQVAVAEEKQKMSYGEIVFQAKNAANSRHNRATYNAAGIASCFIYPVGLPVAILYTESGVASNMNPYDPVYLDLDPGQKNQYRYAYKQEEKQLRRKSIYGAEGVCVGAFFFFLMTVDGM
jgi:hypothetical protein